MDEILIRLFKLTLSYLTFCYVFCKSKLTRNFMFHFQKAQDRSRILLKAIDDYGLGVAATFNGSTKSTTVQTKNLLVAIKRVDQDSPV